MIAAASCDIGARVSLGLAAWRLAFDLRDEAREIRL